MTGDRVRAVAACDMCPWRAEHTGDDYLEVAMFLRKLLIAHVTSTHADHVATAVLRDKLRLLEELNARRPVKHETNI